MTPLLAFVLAFLATLAALVGVLITGLRWRIRRRRRLHLSLVALSLFLLAWTIHEAYALGHLYDLAAAGWIFHVHMLLARVATVSLLIPTIGGFVILRTGRHHAAHRAAAVTAVTLVTLAALTGFWMVAVAPAIEP